MPDYLTITCRLPATAEEHLACALEGWPVLGCEVRDAGRELDVTVYLEEVRAGTVPAVCEGLQALGASDLSTGHFAEQDWLSGYRSGSKAGPIGTRFWIDPHPETPTPPGDGRFHLLIEPRQAFGTGSHESTQLVLLLLETIPVTGLSVLDVGAGSGILSLAARALGAAWVVGFDIDLEATIIAGQTVQQQLEPLPVALFAGPVAALRRRVRFDLILANLLPDQSAPLLGHIGDMLRPDGTLVLSGLMADQRASVEAELKRRRLAVTGESTQGEWVALVCNWR